MGPWDTATDIPQVNEETIAFSKVNHEGEFSVRLKSLEQNKRGVGLAKPAQIATALRKNQKTVCAIKFVGNVTM